MSLFQSIKYRDHQRGFIYKVILVIPWFFLLTIITSIAQQTQVVIDNDFAGGNIIIDNPPIHNSTEYYHLKVRERDTIRMRPDLRDTYGKWFYWNFRIRGAQGRSLTFSFPYTSIGKFGPAISTDNGSSWKWLYDQPTEEDKNFTYLFDSKDSVVQFCVGIPYVYKDFEEFIQPFLNNPYVSKNQFCHSNSGRVVENLTIKKSGSKPQYKILVTARHHACEMMASFVLEGMIEQLLTKSSEEVQWLKNNVEFMFIPFVDIDGVETGDQGKNRMPRDHDLDYIGKSIYNTISVIRNKIPEWSSGELKVVLDLHCPYLRDERNGDWNELIYFVGLENKDIDIEVRKLCKILSRKIKEKSSPDGLPFSEANYLPFGTNWNTSADYSEKGIPIDIWAGEIEEIKISSTIEIPYSNCQGKKVMPDNLRGFGGALIIALSSYLNQPEGKE